MDIGDLIRFGNPSQDAASDAFRDIAGAATNPTAVTLTIEKPDGTTKLHYGWPSGGVDGTLTNESAGRFYAAVLIDQSGTWRYRLVGTGAVSASAERPLTIKRRRVTP